MLYKSQTQFEGDEDETVGWCGDGGSGTFMTLQETFCIVDLLMGLMTICNLIAITLLSKKTFVLLEDYKAQRKAGKDPEFHKSILSEKDAKDIECW